MWNPALDFFFLLFSIENYLFSLFCFWVLGHLEVSPLLLSDVKMASCFPSITVRAE